MGENGASGNIRFDLLDGEDLVGRDGRCKVDVGEYRVRGFRRFDLLVGGSSEWGEARWYLADNE